MTNHEPDAAEEAAEIRALGLDVPRSFGDEWIAGALARYERYRDDLGPTS